MLFPLHENTSNMEIAKPPSYEFTPGDASADLILPCPFLHLPVELFEPIVSQLSSVHAHYLALCNRALYSNHLIWKQILRNPFRIVGIIYTTSIVPPIVITLPDEPGHPSRNSFLGIQNSPAMWRSSVFHHSLESMM